MDPSQARRRYTVDGPPGVAMPDSLEALLRQALEEDLDHRADRLADLLDEAELLHRHGSLSLPADLRRHLDARAIAVARELTTLLVEWRQAGGELALDLPELFAQPVAGDADGTEMPPAEPVAEDPGTSDLHDKDDDEDESCPTEEVDKDPLADTIADVGPAPTPEAPPLVEPAPAPPPVPPASLSDLHALSTHFDSGLAHIPDTPPEPWDDALEALLTHLAPRDDDDAELHAIEAAVQHADDWLRYPRPVQQALVGLIATRLRSLQDERHVTGFRVNACFSMLTRFSKTHEPGFVFGLARDHRPAHGSWSEDADRWSETLAGFLPVEESHAPSRGKLLAELERVVDELQIAPDFARSAVRQQAVRKVRDVLEGGVRSNDPGLVRLAAPLHDHLEGREFRTLRRAIRDAVYADGGTNQDDMGDDDAAGLGPSWPWWSLTAGRQAVMVGGDPREPNRRRIEAAFGFSELTWLDTLDKPRALEALRDRILRHGVDFVIVLGGFVGHNYDDVLLPACRDAGVPFAHVDHGYGVTRIRLAIERFTEARGSDAAGPGPDAAQTAEAAS